MWLNWEDCFNANKLYFRFEINGKAESEGRHGRFKINVNTVNDLIKAGGVH